MSQLGQKPFHGLGFVLICLAAQGVKSKFHSNFHQFYVKEFVRIVEPVN